LVYDFYYDDDDDDDDDDDERMINERYLNIEERRECMGTNQLQNRHSLEIRNP
jgi:hypothetical protein